MVVTIKKVSSGNHRYYTSEVGREDYYTRDSETRELPGQWLGQGAKTLGLHGFIYKNDPRLTALFQGRHPYEERELRRGGTTERSYVKADGSVNIHRSVGAYDFTVSPDKSVSVLYAVSSVEVREAISKAHFAAVNAVCQLIESHCFTRTGAKGVTHERARGVFAAFEHCVSRELDPQLHTHLLALNVGLLKDGRTGALDGERLLKLHFECSKVYDTQMRQQLLDRLNLPTIDKPLTKGGSFEVVGVPQELKDAFSKRRKEIEKLLSPDDTAKQVQWKVLATRSPKEKDVDREALFAAWRGVAREYGFDVERFYQNAHERICVHGHKPPAPHEKRDRTRETRIGRDQPPSYDRELERLYEYLFKHRNDIRRELAQASTFFEKSERYWRNVERRFDKAHKQQRELSIEQRENRRTFRQKMLFLYATGRVSRSDYLRYTDVRGLPRSKLGINLSYATYKISRKQQQFLLKKYGHERRKEPQTRIGIEVAYQRDRISPLARMTLLKKHGHLLREAPSPPSFMMEKAKELFVKDREREL